MSIIGCHFILCCINSFQYLQIQLYDTFSLSLSIMCNVYCAIELRISFMVFIKQLKPRIFVQCKCCNTDWSLAFTKVRVVGLNPIPGTGSFFLPFFSSTSFLLSLDCAFTQVCMRVCGQVLCVFDPVIIKLS